MKINMFLNKLDISADKNEYIDGRFRLMLGRYESRVKKIQVYLSQDIASESVRYNCFVKIFVNGKTAIDIQDSGPELNELIDKCANLGKRKLKRMLNLGLN